AQLLASANAKIETEPALADLHGDAAEALAFVHGRLKAHETLGEFFQKRDDALFHATLSTGEGSGGDVRSARDKAREALAVVGITSAAGEPWTLDDSFTPEEKDQVREKCYELLLVWADAEAQPLPGQSRAEQRSRAADALRILDRAPPLGLRTKAHHLRRARILELCGLQEEAR